MGRSGSFKMVDTRKRKQLARMPEPEVIETTPIPIQSKKPRGPTLMNDIWELEDGVKMEVQVGTGDIPVGSEAAKLANFIGSVVRRSDLTPLGYSDWRLLESKYKSAILEAVEAKIEFRPTCSEGTRKWIMRSAATKWRSWKNELKSRAFDKRLTPEEMWEKITDARVDKRQFLAIAEIWLSDVHQQRCEKNREIRQRFDDPHCTGTKSFARLIHEKAQAEGVTPTRADIYVTSRKHRDGSAVNDKAKDLMALMEKHQHESGSSGIHGVSSWQGDAYSKVKGPEKKGNIRCSGLPASKDITTTTPSTNRNMQETLNGVLDILAMMTQMWKQHFPNANIDNIVETAKHLATQARAGLAQVPDATSAQNNSEREDIGRENNGLRNTIQDKDDQCQIPSPVVSHDAECPSDHLLTKERNNSREPEIKNPKRKRKQKTARSPVPTAPRVTRNASKRLQANIETIHNSDDNNLTKPAEAINVSELNLKEKGVNDGIWNASKKLKANTETIQNNNFDDSLTNREEDVTKAIVIVSEPNLTETVNDGIFQSVVDIAMDAVSLSQVDCNLKHDFQGYDSIAERERKIIQAFLENLPDKLNAHFYTPLGNFCFGRQIHDLLYCRMVEDTIMHMYMDVLYHKHSKPVEESPFYFAALNVMQLIKNRVKKGTDAEFINLVNLFKCHQRNFEHLRKVFCVMLTSKHWHLLVTDFEAKKFKVYNSMSEHRRQKGEAERWKEWVAEFYTNYTDNSTEDNLYNWELEFVKDCPQQASNSMDSGVFVIKFMEYLCEDREPDFSQKDIPRFRAEIAATLLTCGGKKNMTKMVTRSK